MMRFNIDKGNVSIAFKVSLNEEFLQALIDDGFLDEDFEIEEDEFSFDEEMQIMDAIQDYLDYEIERKIEASEDEIVSDDEFLDEEDIYKYIYIVDENLWMMEFIEAREVQLGELY